ncbi:MAG: hypothetical protein ACN6I4_00660 [bacterium]
MYKKLLLLDIIIQFVLILTALFLLIYFKETDRASLVFYFGLGGYQLATHYIKIYRFNIKHADRIGFYNTSLKLFLFSASIVLFFAVLGYLEILFELAFLVFIWWGYLMLVIGPILALINIVISIQEYRDIEK